MTDRVTELIRACSREVVRRRTINAQAEIYKRALDEIVNTNNVFTIHSLALKAELQAQLINPEDYGRP